MTSHFGCLQDVMRLACDVRLKFLNNNNNNDEVKPAAPSTSTDESDMADTEQVPDDDCEIKSDKTEKQESEVDEELLFELEITRRSNGSVTGEESDSESFHTCDASSDLENGEQTTSGRTNSIDDGSDDSGYTFRRSRFAKLRLDTLTKIDINKQNIDKEISSSKETLTKPDEDESEGDDQNAVNIPTITQGGPSPTPEEPGTSYSSSWNESGSLWDLVDPNSPIYDEEEFRFNREDLRRSTSLKADKTPPDTPRRKKVVRFADTLGLDLESVRHILNLDSPPRIPLSAMTHLKEALPFLQPTQIPTSDQQYRYLSAQFPQPGAADNFLQRVKDQTVCLENAMITYMTITGTVRVSNISYHKSVKIRYTTNNWLTFTDVHANYVPNSCDGPTDRFSFSIVCPADMPVGTKLMFCICYSVGGTTYWDSNHGLNYVVECYVKAFPSAGMENTWMHFM